MQPRHALVPAVAGMLAAAISCSGSDPALVARLHADPDSLSRCFIVVATGEDGGRGESRPHAVSAGDTLSIGVFRGPLSDRVTLQAQGFSSADCVDPPDERSDSRTGTFVAGSFPVYNLTLHGEGACDDGLDGDGDGRIDCADPACAASSPCADGGTDGGTTATSAFPYPPSNFSPDALAAPDAGLIIDCDAGYDTGTRTGFLCGAPLPPSYLLDGGAVLLAVSDLTITITGQWHITGSRPLIVAVFGDAGINGALLAGAVGAVDGPGVARGGCPGSGDQGLDGGNGGGGGGGAGYGRPGAPGSHSAGTTPAAGGDGGAAFGTAELVPLLGGCPGGQGGVQNTVPPMPGGGGGGAIQLSAAGNLKVSYTIAAPGGGGQGSATASNNGGGGGGSGGAILLEANQLDFTASARVTANGGAGAEGCDGTACTSGQDGRIDGSQPALGGAGHSIIPGGDGGAGTVDPTSGTIVGGSNFGGGGGGGGVGRIRLNAADRCTFAAPPSQVLSPPATSNRAGDAGCP